MSAVSITGKLSLLILGGEDRLDRRSEILSELENYSQACDLTLFLRTTARNNLKALIADWAIRRRIEIILVDAETTGVVLTKALRLGLGGVLLFPGTEYHLATIYKWATSHGIPLYIYWPKRHLTPLLPSIEGTHGASPVPIGLGSSAIQFALDQIQTKYNTIFEMQTTSCSISVDLLRRGLASYVHLNFLDYRLFLLWCEILNDPISPLIRFTEFSHKHTQNGYLWREQIYGRLQQAIKAYEDTLAPGFFLTTLDLRHWGGLAYKSKSRYVRALTSPAELSYRLYQAQHILRSKTTVSALELKCLHALPGPRDLSIFEFHWWEPEITRAIIRRIKTPCLIIIEKLKGDDQIACERLRDQGCQIHYSLDVSSQCPQHAVISKGGTHG